MKKQQYILGLKDGSSLKKEQVLNIVRGFPSPRDFSFLRIPHRARIKKKVENNTQNML